MNDMIQYAYTSQIGKRRGNNEDNFWVNGEQLPMINNGTENVLEGTVSPDAFTALAVFDGMGGERCGEAASFLAAQEFGHYCAENQASAGQDPEKFIQDLCESMNRKILDYAGQEHIGSMGSTAAMIFFSSSEIYAANLGDSRIYRFSGKRLEQVSEDHVLSGNFLGKAPLTQFLGLQEEEGFSIEPSVCRLRHGESFRILLCSDGLTDMVPEDRIAGRLEENKSVKETVETLLADALENGGKDNVTILLLEVPENQKFRKVRNFLRGIFG